MTAPGTPATPATSSRLSTASLIAIAFVAILVLGGVGILIGKSAESDTKLPSAPIGSPSAGSKSSQLGTQDNLALTPQSLPAGGGPTDNPAADSVTLGQNIANVPVPQGWNVFSGTCDNVYCVEMLGPDGGYAFAGVYKSKQHVNPGVAVTNLLDRRIKQDGRFSEVDSGRVKTTEGTDASGAQVLWVGLFTDPQVIDWCSGEFFVIARSDGWVLVLQLQHFSDTRQGAIDAYGNDHGLTEILEGAANNSFLNG